MGIVFFGPTSLVRLCCRHRLDRRPPPRHGHHCPSTPPNASPPLPPLPTPPLPPIVIVVMFVIAITLPFPRSMPTSTPAPNIILVLRVILKDVREQDSTAAEAVAAAAAVVVAAAAFKGACLVRLSTSCPLCGDCCVIVVVGKAMVARQRRQ
jgi:hypothetical protein